MSETPSEEGFETVSVDDRGVQSLQLCARLDALEACTVELLLRFDESKRNMDRYYHAFLELETVVNQLAENQNGLTEFIQNMPARTADGGGARRGARGGGERRARTGAGRTAACTARGPARPAPRGSAGRAGRAR
jgi:hypothetical protein